MVNLMRHRWSQLTALAAMLLSTGAVAGQSLEVQSGEYRPTKLPKPAWRWTLEERLAARFDPLRMKARAAEEAAPRRKAAEVFGERIDPADNQHSIDGRREPELFLPVELFALLINAAFPEDGQDRAYRRERFEDGAAVLGFGGDLWQRLEKAVSPFLKVRNDRYRRAMRAYSRSESFEDSQSDTRLHCRTRAAALAAAKAEFGEEAFLRLLYEVVAPTMSIDYTVDEDTTKHLRAMEGGCE